jgi:hypothetical protein
MAVGDETTIEHRGAIELIRRMPASPRAGTQIACEWRLVNHSDRALAASFYLRTRPATLAGLVGSGARILCGRFCASATMVIAAGQTLSLAALLVPHTSGNHRLRAAVVTRSETFECVDAVIIGIAQPVAACE